MNKDNRDPVVNYWIAVPVSIVRVKPVRTCNDEVKPPRVFWQRCEKNETAAVFILVDVFLDVPRNKGAETVVDVTQWGEGKRCACFFSRQERLAYSRFSAWNLRIEEGRV